MGNSDNPLKGARSEESVRRFFQKEGLLLKRSYSVDVGLGALRKSHRFDLGCATPPTLVECKCHTWTGGGNAPSAKLSV